MAWQDLPLPIDQTQIINQILTNIATKLPGWRPHEGAVEVALAEEIGVALAAVNQAAQDAMNYAAAGVASALGFAPMDGVRAVLPQVALVAQLPPSTSTVPFSRAVTIPAGFKIAVGDLAYIVPSQVTIVAAFTQVASGDDAGYWRGTILADFRAVEAGDVWNAGVAGDTASIQTVHNTIISATLTGPATGGMAEETLDAFLSRFVAWMSTLKPGGVRAADLAVFASTIAGTRRALALDRYDPANPGTPADRTVTIIPVSASGNDLTTFDVDALRAALEQIREVGFVFHIIDPTRTPVAVDVTFTPASAVEPAVVVQDVQAALAEALSPAWWGTTDGDPATWVEHTELRTLDVALIVATVPGVASLGSITLNGGAGDVALAGPGALIDPTITVAIA